MNLKSKRLSLLLTFALLALNIGVRAQVVSIDYILGAPVQKAQKIALPTKNFLILHGKFGEAELMDRVILDSLHEGRVAKIDLVYTQYVQSETFVQPELNRKRLEYLKKHKPYLFENNLIEWNIVCQTGAKSADEARDYFHGFIVHFRTSSADDEVLTTEEELKKIDSALSDCKIPIGDTICDRAELLKLGKAEFLTVIKIDSIVRIPTGKYEGKYLNIDPFDIPDKNYFEQSVNRSKVMISAEFTDKKVMETPFSKVKRVKVDDTYVPRSKRKAKKGITYRKRSIWGRRQLTEKTVIKDTVLIKIDTCLVLLESDGGVYYRDCYRGISGNYFQDTIVSITFNNTLDWENKIVVEDVTGSMYPYLTQTFLWRRLAVDSTQVSKFLYFNDGDNKPAAERLIGSTGGIYYIESSSIDSIEFRAKQAMAGGNGGDCPENNLEALIYANEICPSCNPLMIADNFAPIRDLILLDLITKPVDVILCGVFGGAIQANYLTLVKKTGGTIYTMEGELHDLTLLKEGETIEFGGQKFLIKDGNFVLTR